MLGFLPCHVNVMSDMSDMSCPRVTLIPVVPGDKLWIDGACLLNSFRVLILDHG
jgi:hypothetical protein